MKHITMRLLTLLCVMGPIFGLRCMEFDIRYFAKPGKEHYAHLKQACQKELDEWLNAQPEGKRAEYIARFAEIHAKCRLNQDERARYFNALMCRPSGALYAKIEPIIKLMSNHSFRYFQKAGLLDDEAQRYCISKNRTEMWILSPSCFDGALLNITSLFYELFKKQFPKDSVEFEKLGSSALFKDECAKIFVEEGGKEPSRKRRRIHRRSV